MVDYEEDYLQKLISAKFGSNWIVIISELTLPPSSGDSLMTVTVTFPDQAGGTPGYTMVTANVPLASMHSAPYRVTANDLQATMRTDAGAGLTGFGVKGFTSFGPGHSVCALYIKLNQAMPKSPFRVRVNVLMAPVTHGTGDIQTFSVATVRNIKPGLLSTAPLNDAIMTEVDFKSGATETGTVDGTFIFRVHPSSLQVDDPDISV